MEEALIALIRADANVITNLGARVYWVRRPQIDSVYPSCVLQRIAGERKYHMTGPDGLSNSRVQIDVWAETYGAAKIAMRAVIAVLTGYNGGVFQGIFIESERDLQDEETDANIRLYRVSADAQIWHTE